jgi:predicted nucleic acid-binding protein
MLDTSALLAALVDNHAWHALARPHLPRPERSRLPGIVLAETYARLRGEPFRVSAEAAASLLSPWWTKGEILATPAELYARALEDAPTLNLGGQIHDYLIALTCAHHRCPLVTTDRRQADLARAVFEDVGRQLTLIDVPQAPESR